MWTMLKDSRIRVNGNGAEARRTGALTSLHPAWQEFVRFCQDLGFGEVENLKIQDGLPVLAEVTRKKVKFT